MRACALAFFMLAHGIALAQETSPNSAGTKAPTNPSPELPAFDEALTRAANDLFSKMPAGSEHINLVIDPLIDGASGAQSTATRLIEKRIVEIVRQSYPRFEVKPFSREIIAQSPVVLVGTFTAINASNNASGPRDAYRICLTLADLQSKLIVSKGVSRAKTVGVDVSPTPAFADSPVWTTDPALNAYIKTCQGTKVGDTVDPTYSELLGASTLISNGIQEYDIKHYREALAYYREALNLPKGNQLRALNGVYLSNWKLDRRDDATDSFGNLINYSLTNSKLQVRFLFKPGSTQFIDDPELSSPYPMWLSQIGIAAVQQNVCLEIVGHTSRTGPAQLNERLSVLRAEFVRELLQGTEPRLSNRLIATGVGSRENIVGTAKDDASDAIDRRVEFKVNKC
jgi:outer membrane protein OmpA-like peptidoglycan-associated protein